MKIAPRKHLEQEPRLAHVHANCEPERFQNSAGQDGFDVRVLNLIERVDGYGGAMIEVFGLEDERQIEEVEEKRDGHIHEHAVARYDIRAGSRR